MRNCTTWQHWVAQARSDRYRPPTCSSPAGFRHPGLYAPGIHRSASALRPSSSRMMLVNMIFCCRVADGLATTPFNLDSGKIDDLASHTTGGLRYESHHGAKQDVDRCVGIPLLCVMALLAPHVALSQGTGSGPFDFYAHDAAMQR